MIEALLLFGLLALAVAYARLARRFAAVEQRVMWLEDGPVQRPAPTPEPELRLRQAEPVVAQTGPVVAQTGTVDAPVAPPASEPTAEPAPILERAPAAPRETVTARFERLVGGRLLVWTGGIAVALAGLFLVRYSIELGLIGPRTRMIAAAIFGIALLGAGEVARRRLPDDPRIGQALVGAGVLILYAAAYGSHVLYGLIGLGTAFVLMAAVAAVALGLSLRHGTPTAVLGLVGGFLTPLLVGDTAAGAAPLLGYLAMLNVAVFAVAMRSDGRRLARAAQILTLLWTGSLLFSARGDLDEVGLFVLAYAIASSLVLKDAVERLASGASSFALAQLALIVAFDDYRWFGWGLFLAFAAVGFVVRRAALASATARALPTALLLLASHATQTFGGAPAAAVGAATTLLFAGGSWWRLERGGGDRRFAWMICLAAAGPALVLRVADPTLLPPPAWGALFVALATAPAALAWRLRDGAKTDPRFDRSLLLAAGTAAVLVGAAVFDLTPDRVRPLGWMLVALGVTAGARRLGDGGVVRLALVAGGLASLAAAARVPSLWATLAASLGGEPALASALPSPADAALLLGGPALVWLGLWLSLPRAETELARIAGWAATGFAAAAGYVLFKQIFALATPADFAARGFAERTLLTQSLFFAGWVLFKRPRMQWLVGIALPLTGLAAARFVWFDLLVLNPAWRTQNVGALPLFNLLAPAYFGSAFWLWEARRRAADGRGAVIMFALFLLALVAGTALLVRQLFGGAVLTGGAKMAGEAMGRPEFYGYSLAGLLLAVALLLWGWRRGDTPLRAAGLALLTATVVKVFAIDAAALEGLLRIASFLGLGVALIGMGKLYGTVLGRGAPHTGDASPAKLASRQA